MICDPDLLQTVLGTPEAPGAKSGQFENFTLRAVAREHRGELGWQSARFE